MKPPVNHCQPECKASKAEVCSDVGTEARCVCRPGFARMFPDRPCKREQTIFIDTKFDFKIFIYFEQEPKLPNDVETFGSKLRSTENDEHSKNSEKSMAIRLINGSDN